MQFQNEKRKHPVILPIDGVDGEPGAEKAAITPVTFVGKWIAVRRTTHHVIEVEDIALGSAASSVSAVPPARMDHRHGRLDPVVVPVQ